MASGCYGVPEVTACWLFESWQEDVGDGTGDAGRPVRPDTVMSAHSRFRCSALALVRDQAHRIQYHSGCNSCLDSRGSTCISRFANIFFGRSSWPAGVS